MAQKTLSQRAASALVNGFFGSLAGTTRLLPVAQPAQCAHAATSGDTYKILMDEDLPLGVTGSRQILLQRLHHVVVLAGRIGVERAEGLAGHGDRVLVRDQAAAQQLGHQGDISAG